MFTSFRTKVKSTNLRVTFVYVDRIKFNPSTQILKYADGLYVDMEH